MKVNISTSNRDNGALQEVGAKTGDLPKTLEDRREVLDIILNGSNKKAASSA
jgi:hypothetical protein